MGSSGTANSIYPLITHGIRIPFKYTFTLEVCILMTLKISFIQMAIQYILIRGWGAKSNYQYLLYPQTSVLLTAIIANTNQVMSFYNNTLDYNSNLKIYFQE